MNRRRTFSPPSEPPQRLEVGLFVIGEMLLLRDGDVMRWFHRDEVAELKVRFRQDGDDPSRDWVHVMLSSGEDVPTNVLYIEEKFAPLKEWSHGAAKR